MRFGLTPALEFSVSKVKMFVFCVSFVAVCFTAIFVWHNLEPRTFLPATKWLKVQEARESIGRDALYCLKIRLTKEESTEVISNLALSPVVDISSTVSSSLANCKAEWWDIDFPNAAQEYKTENDGQVRVLAAYRDGVFYYTHELR